MITNELADSSPFFSLGEFSFSLCITMKTNKKVVSCKMIWYCYCIFDIISLIFLAHPDILFRDFFFLSTIERHSTWCSVINFIIQTYLCIYWIWQSSGVLRICCFVFRDEDLRINDLKFYLIICVSSIHVLFISVENAWNSFNAYLDLGFTLLSVTVSAALEIPVSCSCDFSPAAECIRFLAAKM